MSNPVPPPDREWVVTRVFARNTCWNTCLGTLVVHLGAWGAVERFSRIGCRSDPGFG